MYKLLSLLVLVALAAFVFAEEQDQEAAEQYFLRYGYYPSWYHANYGVNGAYTRGYYGYPYYTAATPAATIKTGYYGYPYGYSYGLPYAY